MQYRINQKNGDKLSNLAFGCMRLPKDKKVAEEIVDYAINNGVNYFDTAYVYPGNEVLLGEILSKNGRREKIKIATKIPHYLIKKTEDFDIIFNKELERLQTTYIDYYLIHMLSDVSVYNRIVDLGLLQWIKEKKEKGQIINIGFSFHGGKQAFVELVDVYDWEFCMIQFNYLDINNQACESGLMYAHSKGIPVMIMEPLRGGSLVNKLPKKAVEQFYKSNSSRTPAEWALKFVYNYKEVTTVLSGMKTLEMLKENIRVANEAEINGFTHKDKETIEKVREILNQSIKVPCTGCNYCMPCPKNVDIPTCLSSYNDIALEGKIQSRVKYMMKTLISKESTNASKCVSCKACETHCPQKIEISKELKEVAKNLEGITYKPIRFFVEKFMNL